MHIALQSEQCKGKPRITALKRISERQSGSVWRTGSCEHGNEPSGSIKAGELLE